MDLSIVILNYRTTGLLRQCLKGIYRSNSTVRFECIIVDNASDPSLNEVLQEESFKPETTNLWGIQPANIHVIQLERNKGYASGNNVGIAKAQGRYILILNPDVAVFQHAFDVLCRYLDEHSDVGMVGPRLNNPDGSIQYSCHAFPTITTPFYRRTFLGLTRSGQANLKRYTMEEWNHQEESEVDWLMGSAFMVRKQALDTVGLLDDRFFMYFEDIDWCRRFWKYGWKVVYVPQAHMTHYHQRMSASLSPLSLIRNRPARAHVISAVKYFWKYRNEPHPRNS